MSSAKLCSPGKQKFGSVAPETGKQGSRRLAKRALKNQVPGGGQLRSRPRAHDVAETPFRLLLTLNPSVLSHLHHLHRLHHIHAKDYWRNARPQRRWVTVITLMGAVCLLRHNGLPRFPIVSGWYGRRSSSNAS